MKKLLLFLLAFPAFGQTTALMPTANMTVIDTHAAHPEAMMVKTTLTADVVIGATSVTVASAADIYPGIQIFVGTGIGSEILNVSSSYTSGTTVALSSATTLFHASGSVFQFLVLATESSFNVAGTQQFKPVDGTTPLFDPYIMTTDGSTWTRRALLASGYRTTMGICPNCSVGKPAVSPNGTWMFSVQSDLSLSTGSTGAASTSPFKPYPPDFGGKFDIWAASSAPFTSSNSGRLIPNGLQACEVQSLCGNASTTIAANISTSDTSVTLTDATGLVAGQNLVIDTGGNQEAIRVAMTYASGTTVPIQTNPVRSHTGAGSITVTYAKTYNASAAMLDGHACPLGDCFYIGASLHSNGLAAPNNFTQWTILIFSIDSSTIPKLVRADYMPGPNQSADLRGQPNLNCGFYMKPTGAYESGSDLLLYVNATAVGGGNSSGVFTGTSGSVTMSACDTALGIFGRDAGAFAVHWNLTTHTAGSYTQIWPVAGQAKYSTLYGVPKFYAEFPEYLSSRFFAVYTPWFTPDTNWSVANNQQNPNRIADIVLVDNSLGTFIRLTNANESGAQNAKFGSGNFGNLSYVPFTNKMYSSLGTGGGDLAPGQVFQTVEMDLNYTGFPGAATSLPGITLLRGWLLRGCMGCF